MRNRIIVMTLLALVGIALASCSGDSATEPADTAPTNSAPRISSLSADPQSVEIAATAVVTCTASDDDGDALAYAWSVTAGTITGSGEAITWTAPDAAGSYTISCTVSDARENATDSVDVTVSETVVPGTMALVPGGTFVMGDSYAEGSDDEVPAHSISLSGFYIGKYEVTQSEWNQYLMAPTLGFGAGETHPIYSVGWFQIILYCNYKSIAEGLTPCYDIAGSTDPSDWPTLPDYSSDSSFATWNAVQCNWSADGYRLPTEAEWEYAARGGASNTDDYRYSGGQTLESVGWFGDNSPDGTRAVGGKMPNQLGLYDMSGNVYEFCWDWYAEDYYTTCDGLGTVANPTGPDSGDMRMVKGGGWGGDAANCRVAGRFRNYPVGGYSHSGFRLVRIPGS